MTTRKFLLASVARFAVIAFVGWKKDADGKLVTDADGNPIYENEAGQEQSVQGSTISNLNKEAKNHREAKEAVEAKLAKFARDGKLLDPDAAFKAVDDISKIDAKKLIDAGEVDKVRDTVKAEFTGLLTEKDNAIKDRDTRIADMAIGGVFANSDFVRDRLAMPRDFFEASMRSNFKYEDGKIAAYDRNGNRLMSKKNAGEYATGDEALELLVDMHPQKDTIVKAPQHGGSGGPSGGGGRGGARTMRRADFDALPAGDKASIAAQMGKGEVKIVD